MFLFRQKYHDLKEWKHSSYRKPLVIRGARQVGKTSLVEEFGQKEFKTVITINFEEEPSFKRIFSGDLIIADIISALEVKRNQVINPETTLIFFDEIQECPEAITALRFFYEKAPQYAVIAAGSLLEFALQTISFPVGRIDILHMYPLNFYEFLIATNHALLAQKIPDLSVNNDLLPTLDPNTAEFLLKACDQYLMIGGMPEAVARFVEKKSMLEVFKVQNTLIKTLIDDTRKYTKGDKQLENIAHVLQRIPRFIGQEITYTTIGEDESHQRTKKSLELLSLAKICSYVYAAGPSSIPLSAEVNFKHFKCIFLDVGLACRILSAGAVFAHINEMDEMAIGKLCEQFVGQEILANTMDLSMSLHCWIRPQRTAKAEVDYLITRQGKNIAIEVKNSSFAKLKSLKVLLQEYPNIQQAFVLARDTKFQVQGRIKKMPIFCKV